MFKSIKRIFATLLTVLGLTALVIGLLGFQPASASSATASSASYANDKFDVTATAATPVKIGDATQVSWMNENHSVPFSPKALKKAPIIKVSPTMTSAKLYQKSHHAQYVICKGSWQNHGMNGQLKVPFNTDCGLGMVMVWNKTTKIYEHGWTLRLPSQVQASDQVVFSAKLKLGKKKLTVSVVKSCLNDFGYTAPPQPVVVTRYAADFQVAVTINASASTSATVSVSCPNGPSASATTNGTASLSITVFAQAKVIATVVQNKKDELNKTLVAQAHADGSASAYSQASASVNCDTPPPPVTYQPPAASANAGACVNPGQQTGVITVNVTNPNSVGTTYSATIGGKPNQTGSIAAGASIQLTFSGFAPGSYSGNVSFGSPINMSVPISTTVQACDVPQTPKPVILEVETINDVLVGNTRTITVRGTVASGHTASLFATARNGGSITADKTQTVSGSFVASVTYKAPSEVPPANGDIAAGKDRVEFTLTQDDGQQATGKTNDFVITPRPITPAFSGDSSSPNTQV